MRATACATALRPWPIEAKRCCEGRLRTSDRSRSAAPAARLQKSWLTSVICSTGRSRCCVERRRGAIPRLGHGTATCSVFSARSALSMSVSPCRVPWDVHGHGSSKDPSLMRSRTSGSWRCCGVWLGRRSAARTTSGRRLRRDAWGPCNRPRGGSSASGGGASKPDASAPHRRHLVRQSPQVDGREVALAALATRRRTGYLGPGRRSGLRELAVPPAVGA